MTEDKTLPDSIDLGQRLTALGARITTAESCTGGLLAGAITDVAGSSAWFDCSVVTYSNQAKQAMLNIDDALLLEHGAVSEACVRAMATGAIQLASAQVAVAISGIAGPDGATAGKPLGTVWIAWALALADSAVNNHSGRKGNQAEPELSVSAECFQFSGNRLAVRQQAVVSALRGTISRIDQIMSQEIAG